MLGFFFPGAHITAPVSVAPPSLPAELAADLPAATA
jgi:hypothetical protein